MADTLEQRIDDPARNVFLAAKEEALHRKHWIVQPEHVLIGILRQENSTAMQALRSMGVQWSTVYSSLMEHMLLGDSSIQDLRVELHPAVETAIELAIEEAGRLGHAHVGTEHLLLGLIAEEKSLPAQILQPLGVDLERTRTAVVDVIRSYRDDGVLPLSLSDISSAHAALARISHTRVLQLVIEKYHPPLWERLKPSPEIVKLLLAFLKEQLR